MPWPWQSQIKFVLRPGCLPLRLIGISCRCLAIVCMNQPLSFSFRHRCNWAHRHVSLLPRQNTRHLVIISAGIHMPNESRLMSVFWKISKIKTTDSLCDSCSCPYPEHMQVVKEKICMNTHTHRETHTDTLSLSLVFLQGPSQYYISYWLFFYIVCCKSLLCYCTACNISRWLCMNAGVCEVISGTVCMLWLWHN